MNIKINNSRKLTLSILTIVLCLGFISTEKYVFICKGKYSKKYHLIKNCRGLSNCSTETYKVALSTAQEIGRTLCGWEN